MESSPYMEGVAASRSVKAFADDPLASLQGTQIISIETEDLKNDDFRTFVHDNFEAFIRLLDHMRPDDRDMLISYYVLGKTQTQLAKIFATTQTVASFRLRSSVAQLASFVLFAGHPTADMIRPILLRHGLEHMVMDILPRGRTGQVHVHMSEIIGDYIATRSFAKVALKHNVHRPDIRRKIKIIIHDLDGKQDMEGQALGAYLFRLLDKAHASGTGLTNRQRNKQGPMHISHIHLIGNFRIQLTNNEAKNNEICDAVFAPKAMN